MSKKTKEPIVVRGFTVKANEYYTTAQAIKILDMSVDTLRSRWKEGLLERAGTGRKILYKGESLINYLDSGQS